MIIIPIILTIAYAITVFTIVHQQEQDALEKEISDFNET